MSPRLPPTAARSKRHRCSDNYKQQFPAMVPDEAAYEEEEDEDDPDYIFFLNHLSTDQDGASYVFHANDTRIHYERNHREDHNCNNRDSCENNDEDDDDHAPEDDNETWSLALAALLDSDGAAFIDGDYFEFLQNLRLDPGDGSIMLQLENNVSIRYEEDEEEDEEPFDAKLAPITKKGDQREIGGASAFSVELRKILERPFNKHEYDRLMELATKRKPLIKYRHLRNDDVPYETDEMGASFFDYYPELCTQVRCADQIRGLELLRGFFFWLINLEHEGAYKPWV